jgi:iron(III) transport system ATP-binding protein
LSGGQQQRVAVARAIVLEPQVLLFDEPLSNLDAKLRRRVREEIRTLQQDLSLTVVYVTHDQEEALAVSDRIIVMNMARIAQDGTPRSLYEQPNSHFVADFIGDANLLPVTIVRHDGAQAIIRLGAANIRLPHHDVPPGPAELAIRPRALRLERATEGLHEGLIGRIAKAAYLGDHMEYQVAVDGLAKELFVIDADVAAPRGAGDRVRVAFDAGGAALVRS